MSDFARVSMAVKFTFFDVVEAEAAPQAGARRRPNSTPPALGRGLHEMQSGDADVEATDAQLVRLNAIVRDGAKLESLSDASTAPSPTGTSSSPRWSSYGMDGCDEDETPVSAGISPTTAGLFVQNSGAFYPSVGSAGHAAGTCRPCAFARSSAGCKFGVECNFCHVVEEHAENVRMRPCKGKRERFKRTMAAIEARVAENPDLLSKGELALPSFVDRYPQARARVMAQLAQVAAEAYRGMGGSAPQVA